MEGVSAVSIQEKKVSIVRYAKCGGDPKVVGIYDHASKSILDNYYEAHPLNEFFENLLSSGTNQPTYQAFLQVEDFKRLHDELMSTLSAPKFKEGQMVWRRGDKWSGGAGVYRVGALLGWKKTPCKIDGSSKIGEPVIVAMREFFHSQTGSMSIMIEDDFDTIENMKAFAQGSKLISKLKNELGIKGLTGGTIIFGGKAYSF